MAGLFGGSRRLPNINTQMGADIARERGGLLDPTGMPGAPMQPQPRKRGLFAPGGVGRGIAGTIGDVLLQRGGLAPVYGPAMQDQQHSLLEEAQRQAEHDEWLSREQWKLDHQPPPNNDTINDWNFYNSLPPEQREQYAAYLDVVNPRNVVGADGIPRFMPRTQAQTPDRPVGRLTPIDGGPGGSPSGAGFR